ncbi:hypothetical protein BJV78DRAFT_1280962 [Lactifluus subvellereus]|nr:hypothetical protein BJV78DRAFT_1280962 [Lactifluus subvellereus]
MLLPALIGGHGINEACVYELRTLSNTHPPFVETVYPCGDALPGSLLRRHPGVIPVSFPLIDLSHFTQYLVVTRVSGPSPAELSVHLFDSSSRLKPVTITSSEDASFIDDA